MAGHWLIRRATSADASALATLERDCFSDPWSLRAFEETLRTPVVRVLLAEATEVVLGYLVYRSIGGEAEILNLAVAPSERRRGLGAALLEAALTALSADGAVEVFLEVRESNAGAKALYQRRGFEEIGRRRRYYRQPVEDAIVLRLPLSAAHESGTVPLDLG